MFGRIFRSALIVALVWGFFALCKERDPNAVNPHLDAPFPQKLSEWNLIQFKPQTASFEPNTGVIPYDLNTPLFTDYASKFRTIYVPKGETIKYNDQTTFDIPVGSILSKTFYYPDIKNPKAIRLIETRLLVHTSDGWIGLPYIWNDEMTEATLEIAGGTIPVSYIHNASEKHYDISYQVPNQNQCESCHISGKTMTPIGIKARHINKDYVYPGGQENQLAHWIKLGILDKNFEIQDAPKNAVFDDTKENLNLRARAYLDANCSHCHNPKGPADTSGLDLQPTATENEFGVCKTPVAAGRGSGGFLYDIVPGQPHKSILLFRMDSTDPGIMMPELARTIIHEEGVSLIRAWIQSIHGNCKPAMKMGL